MAVEVRMPAYSESMEEADVVGWLVSPGDRVNQGDPIAEIETDKATGELESPATGVLTQILVPEGSLDVKVGELLALIEPVSQAEAGAPSPTETGTPDRAENRPPEPEATQPAASSLSQVAPEEVTPEKSARALPVSASALARRLADRAGLDLSTIPGSGANGRILKADVESVSGAGSGPLQEEVEVAPSNQAHGALAPPQHQLRVECRADRAKAACEQLSALEPDTPIPFLALIVRAAAGALREVPEANTAWISGELVRQDEITLALGLPTERNRNPVQVRDADRKSLSVLADEIAAAASPPVADTTEAGTAALSIVDVGDADVESIQLSVVPPCVCALGTGALVERPVAEDGELGVGIVLSCTLAADSRAIDPQSAARLLAAFKLRLEDPLEMLLS